MCKNEFDDSEAAFKRVVKKVAKAKPDPKAR